MDIVSHGLWAGALYRWAQNKKHLKLRPVWAGFWGVFPDLFAFAPGMASVLLGRLLGNATKAFEAPENGSPGFIPLAHLTDILYSLSHSLIVFGLVFCLIWLMRSVILKQSGPYWELGGWGLHILMDIPTHQLSFFPTPFLWPLSNVYIDGIAWSQPWFMAVNFVLLVLAYTFLYRKKILRKK